MGRKLLMPVNNFKPFAIASGSNVTSQTEWEGLIALSTGFTAGWPGPRRLIKPCAGDGYGERLSSVHG